MLNGLLEEGVLKDYAIGGGMAALAYVEPFLTEDIDVFTTIDRHIGTWDPAAIFMKHNLTTNGLGRIATMSVHVSHHHVSHDCLLAVLRVGC